MEAGKLFEKARSLGIRGTMKMGAVKWKKLEKDFHFPTAPGRSAVIDRILGRGYKRIVIFENHFGYKNIMKQRPQHLLRNMGDDGTLVLYNSYYDVDYEGRGRITQIGRSAYVLDMYYYRDYLLKALKSIKNRYLMVYSTDTVPRRRIEGYLALGFKVIYEYVDDINPELIAPGKIGEILKRHDALLRDKRVLAVATADRLYENVQALGGRARAVQISNGAECVKFNPESTTGDKQYLDWLDAEKIHVGYYGALAGWVDYELLGRLAQAGADIFDLGGVSDHGLLGGLEHVVAVVRGGLAQGAAFGLGLGHDLGGPLLGAFDDLGLAHQHPGPLLRLADDGLGLGVGRIHDLAPVVDDGLGLAQLAGEVGADLVQVFLDLVHVHDPLAPRQGHIGAFGQSIFNGVQQFVDVHTVSPPSASAGRGFVYRHSSTRP